MSNRKLHKALAEALRASAGNIENSATYYQWKRDVEAIARALFPNQGDSPAVRWIEYVYGKSDTF